MSISKKIRSAGAMTLGLAVGLGGVAGATSGTIGYTGPDSYNKIEASAYNRTHVSNDNDVTFGNSNSQHAWSGHASVVDNTTGGHAETGDAVNSNATKVSAAFNNAPSTAAALKNGAGLFGSDSAKINTTGPDSYNKIELKKFNKVSVHNDNDIVISNTNSQFAKSGSAEVFHNTTGGSAVTGDARNTNSTVVDLKVTN